MPAETIISQSGTEHVINPAPQWVSKLASGRTQTLCEMHLKAELAAPPTGEKCGYCAAIAKQMERK